MDINKIRGGSIGLGYPMLARINYTAWTLKMKVLQAQRVQIVIEASDAKTPVEEKTHKVALAMIYQGIPQDMLLRWLTRRPSKSVKKAREAIKTPCQGADRVKKVIIQTLKVEFESLTMNKNELLDDFIVYRFSKLTPLYTHTLFNEQHPI